MTMDPRIEAALVEFARTQCLPAGYTLSNPSRESGLDVYVKEPWVVTRDAPTWKHWAATESVAVAAAWAHSDRIDVPPPGYAERPSEKPIGWWRVFYTGLPHWSFESDTREGAIAKAWAHHDLHGPFEQHHDPEKRSL